MHGSWEEVKRRGDVSRKSPTARGNMLVRLALEEMHCSGGGTGFRARFQSLENDGTNGGMMDEKLSRLTQPSSDARHWEKNRTFDGIQRPHIFNANQTYRTITTIISASPNHQPHTAGQSNCVVHCHVPRLGRGSCWLTCLPQ